MSDRQRRNVGQLIRFGVVGASGVLVNMATLIAVRKLGPHFEEAIVGIPLTEFNLRWYHVYSTIAFLVASLSNFQLNRTWTFKSAAHARWWREYWPFLTVGMMGQLIGLGLLTLLLHPHSVISLPTSIFDDTSGFRSRLYWAQLTVIALVTPLSFVLNKLWTFAAVRTHRLDLADPTREESLLGDD
jgi:putative flippase GtrA